MSDASRREKIFKRKALLTWRAALSLLEGNPNSAANRIYYALFQGLLAEYERLGIKPEKIDAGSSRAAEGDIRLKWTHSFVKNNASLAGLNSSQCTVIREAYLARSDADYSELDVSVERVQYLLDRAKDILECLGVLR